MEEFITINTEGDYFYIGQINSEGLPHGAVRAIEC